MYTEAVSCFLGGNFFSELLHPKNRSEIIIDMIEINFIKVAVNGGALRSGGK